MCRGSASASSVVSEADTDSLGCSWLFFSLWGQRKQGLHSQTLTCSLSPGAHSLLEQRTRSPPRAHKGVVTEPSVAAKHTELL